ncbi:MAG: histidine phosphatase family protein, partial [Lachnospiraceae bacterium]
MWTRTAVEMTITLYIIRHGATKSNKRHAYLGNTNEPLSNEGGEQIIFYNEAGRYPKEKDNLLIFSSPMLRCLQTKDILYPDTRAILLPEWKEIDFGRFEGKNYQDLNGDPDYQRWIDSGGVTAFPGGESRDEFVKRSMAGLEWCIECMEDYKQKSAVCVVHGGTIMAIMSSLTGGDYYDYQVKNGQGY